MAHIDLTGVLGMNACPGQHQTRPKRTSMASLLEMPHLAGQRIQHGHTWQLGSVTLPNQATSRLPTKRRKTVCRDRGPESSSEPLCSTLLPHSVLYFSAILASGQEPCRLSLPWASFLPKGMRCYKEKLEALSVCSVMWLRKKKSNKNTHHTAPISS